MIVQSAFPLRWQKEILIPLVPRFKGGRGALQKKGRCPVKRDHPDSLLNRLDVHLPGVPVRGGMKIAIADENLAFDLDGRIPAHERVLHKRRVLSLLHPDAFFEQGIRKREAPHWLRALQMEGLHIQKSLWRNVTAEPAIRRERKLRPAIADRFIYAGN